MKKINFKKFLLLFCILACVFGLTACTETISSDSAKESKKEQKLAAVSTELENCSVDMIKYFDVTSDDDVKANAENAISIDEINHDLYIVNPEGMNVATVEFCNSWVKSRSDLGRLKSIDSVELKISDETSTLGTVTVKTEYEKRNCTYEIVFDDDYNLSSAAINPVYTTGEKMEKAVLNTVIGMGTVFIVLIFISFIIGLFKYISVFENKSKAKNEASTDAQGVNNAIAQIVSNEEQEEEVDDLELIAVITAAIAASENTSTDGLVVRSIRKVNSRRK